MLLWSYSISVESVQFVIISVLLVDIKVQNAFISQMFAYIIGICTSLHTRLSAARQIWDSSPLVQLDASPTSSLSTLPMTPETTSNSLAKTPPSGCLQRRNSSILSTAHSPAFPRSHGGTQLNRRFNDYRDRLPAGRTLTPMFPESLVQSITRCSVPYTQPPSSPRLVHLSTKPKPLLQQTPRPQAHTRNRTHTDMSHSKYVTLCWLRKLALFNA